MAQAETFLCYVAEAGLPWGQTIPGLGLGLYGCWLAMQADLGFRGGLFLGRFISGRWQHTRV